MEQRLGNKTEPTPVNQECEIVDIKVIRVPVDDDNLLGASKELVRGLCRPFGRYSDSLTSKIRLVKKVWLLEFSEAGAERAVFVGD